MRRHTGKRHSRMDKAGTAAVRTQREQLAVVDHNSPDTWHCYVCGAELDADHVYGPDGMDLCRRHHELFHGLVQFMVDSTSTSKPEQPGLF